MDSLPKTFPFLTHSDEVERGLFDRKAWYVNWGDNDVI